MIALDMAFAGIWDNRAADQRATSADLRSTAAVLPVWRGKPQLAEDGLGWVTADNPVLRHAGALWLYLGQHAGQDRFAADISAWEPDGLDPAALAMFADPSEQHYPGAASGTRFAELRLAMAHLDPAAAALAATARAVFNWHRSHRFCASCGEESLLAMGAGSATARHVGPSIFLAPTRSSSCWSRAETLCFWAARMAGPKGCIPPSPVS